MRKRDQQCIDRIFDGERLGLSDEVRFHVNVDGIPDKGQLMCGEDSRLVLYVRTPMGLQTTIVFYDDIEHLTSGQKNGEAYLQLLGDGSRVLVLFESKQGRDNFRALCAAKMRR